MAQMHLDCRNICFDRAGRTIIDGFSDSFKAGEVVVLQGANGSGKSTLLKLLAGVLKPNGGEVTFGVEDEPELSIHGNLLYIGHKLALEEPLTVVENVALWAKLAGHPELVATALEYFDLNPYADMLVQSLSAGWKQRVALTRLITMPRKLWILDEPTNHLDDHGTALFESLCSARREQGGLIVMSLHGAVSDKYVKIIKLS